MKRRGAILVMTLAVLTAVIAVLAGAAAMQQLAFKAAINRTDRERARLMAESGLQRALTSLASQNPNATTQNDEWFTLGTSGNDKFLLDDGSFRLQIVDANSLVNLNTAAQEQLLRLPLTEEQVRVLHAGQLAGSGRHGHLGAWESLPYRPGGHRRRRHRLCLLPRHPQCERCLGPRVYSKIRPESRCLACRDYRLEGALLPSATRQRCHRCQRASWKGC